MDQVKKPSLGVEPYSIWLDRVVLERKQALTQAIVDRTLDDSGAGIPIEWVNELNRILMRNKYKVFHNYMLGSIIAGSEIGKGVIKAALLKQEQDEQKKSSRSI